MYIQSVGFEKGGGEMREKARDWGGMMFPGSFSPLLPHLCSLSPHFVDGCQPLPAPLPRSRAPVPTPSAFQDVQLCLTFSFTCQRFCPLQGFSTRQLTPNRKKGKWNTLKSRQKYLPGKTGSVLQLLWKISLSGLVQLKGSL